ncbi:MAG: diguanylate cyclase [Lysobacterales bacterium]|jgi:diguanylate cyclase (GGDEF)-like protein|nr:MAG: diguanylate cyclase [Xanthomonadales bacterium]
MSAQEYLRLGDDESRPITPQSEPPPWRVLIVDDDEQVHLVTRYALRGQRILGRRIEFDSAYSAEEARMRLAERRYSLILLDVVMETEDAGLKLVGEIRERFDDPAVRIVLRTGQPGLAPELQVIQNYDINDYRSKSELTTERLVTSLTAALRSYQQICQMEEHRRRLERVLSASAELLRIQGIEALAERVLIQLCSILEVPPCGLLCVRRSGEEALEVLAALGPDAARPPEEVLNPARSARMRAALEAKRDEFGEDHVCLYLETPRLPQFVADIPVPMRVSGLTQRLLSLYAINVMVGLDNAQLFEELEQSAYVDPLTGLATRLALERALRERIARGEPFELLFADIDNFQAVNDGLGYEAGDHTLRAIVAVLKQSFPEALVIARLSADTFALVLPSAAATDAGLSRLNARLRGNLEVMGHRVPIGMSFGSACHPEDGGDAATILRHAGIALKQAKRGFRGSHQRFDRRYEDELERRLSLVGELRSALAEERFTLVYQPQWRLADGVLVGVEALLRWQRSPGDWVSAAEFITAAEDSGQIIPVGAFVLERACAEQRVLAQAGFDVPVSVNLSVRQLQDPGFLRMVEEALRKTGLPPERLELEVTESMLIGGEGPMDLIRELRRRGVRVAVDDFGTGHSSLARLRELPADRLKIDRAFVVELDLRREARVICELVVKLGHALGLRVVAEGVERATQDALLRELGCDEVQGFFYGRPVPLTELLASLRR